MRPVIPFFFFLYFVIPLSITTWRWKLLVKEHMINDEIRVKEVRLVGPEGEQIGIKPNSRSDANGDWI